MRVGIDAWAGGTSNLTPPWRQPFNAPPRASTIKLTRKLHTTNTRRTIATLHSIIVILLLIISVRVISQKVAPTSCHPHPPKLPLSAGILTPSNTCCLEPTWVSPPNGISIHSAVFAQHIGTNIQTTDYATCDICSNRPHLMHYMQALRPKNNHGTMFMVLPS